jgi:hypothetical protein
MLEIQLDKMKQIVRQAGGIFVGIQELGPTRLVLFNSPQTNSTLALQAKVVSVATVQNCIAKSNAKFGK